jgi:hypothetical protein
MFKEEREKFPPKSKDTKKWCKGKKGVEHQLQCVKIIKKYNSFKVEHFEHVCSVCGKVFDFWYPHPRESEVPTMPKWVVLDTKNIITN